MEKAEDVYSGSSRIRETVSFRLGKRQRLTSCIKQAIDKGLSVLFPSLISERDIKIHTQEEEQTQEKENHVDLLMNMIERLCVSQSDKFFYDSEVNIKEKFKIYGYEAQMEKLEQIKIIQEKLDAIDKVSVKDQTTKRKEKYLHYLLSSKAKELGIQSYITANQCDVVPADMMRKIKEICEKVDEFLFSPDRINFTWCLSDQEHQIKNIGKLDESISKIESGACHFSVYDDAVEYAEKLGIVCLNNLMITMKKKARH